MSDVSGTSAASRDAGAALTRFRDWVGRLFKDPEELDLTSGDVGKPLFYLSLPIVITQLLQTAYNLTDTLWLGRYSTEALAAISFSFPLVFLLFALAVGLSIGGSVLVAQYVGADQERDAEYAASQTVAFSVVVALLLGVLGYVAVGPALSLYGASPGVFVRAASYMRIISMGMVFLFGFAVFISLMRGYGDTVTPMLVMFGSVVLNIALDPFLIFGWWVFPELGITGAAIATVFSRGLAFFVGVWIMLRGTHGVRIRVSEMWPDPETFTQLIRIGGPASVEVTGRALSVNAMMLIVGSFATSVVAAYGIGVRVFSVIFLPAIAVAQGVETMTGQNVGADRYDRVAKTNHFAARAMFAILGLMGVAIWLVATPIVSVFTSDAAVIEVGTTYLRYVAPTFAFIGLVRSYTGGFRGTGNTLVAALISIAMLWVIRLPFAALTAPQLGPIADWLPALVAALPALGSTAIWLSFAVSNVAGGVIAYLWFRRGTWKTTTVTERLIGSIDPTDVVDVEEDCEASCD